MTESSRLGCGRRRRRGERGSASLLMAGVMGVVMVLSFAAVVVTTYALAAHRARAAADLSAVSGAAAFVLGLDPCPQAGRTASGNGATVLDCEVTGDQIDYVVTVRVAVTVPGRVRGLPHRVEGLAHAGSAERGGS